MALTRSSIKNDRGLVSEGLKEKTEQLISNFLNGTAPDFLNRHAQILDDYFRESFETSIVGPRMVISKNLYAIIALGGYGRAEQCIHSDVDLLFLFEKRIPTEAEDLIREIIYPLWDIGLEVGYATRSLKECLSLAGKDFEVLSPLLDARFVCGMSNVYSKLIEKLRKKIILKRSGKIIAWLLEGNRDRHIRFGDSTYLLEPNLKEGQGGLRDYHTMLWIARIKFNLLQSRDLEYFGCLSHDEFQALREALSFIWDVRNRLHFLSGRKCDQLHFEYQIEMADALKFIAKNGEQPVERFLGKLHSKMAFVKEQQMMFLHELDLSRKLKPGKKPIRQIDIEGLNVDKEMLNFNSSKDILLSPSLLIDIFRASVRKRIPLSAEAKRLVREFAYLVDDDFSNTDFVVRAFEQILLSRTPGFDALGEMLGTGFLARFIPEFKNIIDRIQYDEYHFYPVDRHSLHTVQEIKTFGTDEDETGNSLPGILYKELFDKKLLLWAALLHDVGKGEQSESHSRRGAEIVRVVLTRKGYKAEDVETVAFLVEEHLLLVKTATRRDIHDEETAILCARRIKTSERLKMLYLLTVADSISTGPKAWNEWVSALLKDFFLKTLSIIEKGELATSEAVETVESKREAIMASASSSVNAKELEALFNVMSPRYLLYTPASNMMEHIELYQNIGESDFVWKVAETAGSDTRRVTVCAKDRPGLFSKVAGIFTLNNLDILDVQVFTWRNNIALDIFEVIPPPDQIFENEVWSRAQKQLQCALADKLDLAEVLKEKMSVYRSAKRRPGQRPHRIIVDNESSSFFTIIEVFAYDFTGLLYGITDALFRCRLDIWVAKIATKVDQVVDVFYVRDFDGQKVDSPNQVEAIKAAIEEVLPDTGPAKTHNK